MRRNALFLLVLLLACFATGIPTAYGLAEGGGHAHAGKIVLDDLSVEDRQRAREIWSHIICSCPKENWSKTLMNCPDGCADPQKQAILMQIREGFSDEQIMDAQVAQWGTKVLAKPDDALTYALPIVFLLACAGMAFFALQSWRKKSDEARDAHGLDVPPEANELAAVERELEELR